MDKGSTLTDGMFLNDGEGGVLVLYIGDVPPSQAADRTYMAFASVLGVEEFEARLKTAFEKTADELEMPENLRREIRSITTLPLVSRAVQTFAEVMPDGEFRLLEEGDSPVTVVQLDGIVEVVSEAGVTQFI